MIKLEDQVGFYYTEKTGMVGELKMLVASEGKFIHKGTDVVVTEKVENHSIWIEVRSMTTVVRLPYGTRIGDLV
jgi:hypothetical protein